MLFVDPFAVAVMIAVCAVVTGATFAVNAALVAPAPTVMLAGTVTALLLLIRASVYPLFGAGSDRSTRHASCREPVMDVVAQDKPLTVGAVFVPVPLRLTVAVPAVLAITSWPL